MFDNAVNKINRFFKATLNCYNKEVGLYSGQSLLIDQIVDENSEDPSVRYYSVQYGFPQSGCVFLNFRYSDDTGKFTITDVSVFAPADGEEVVTANFVEEAEVMEEATVGIKVGADMQTVERVGLEAIEKSHNALQMLDMAIGDLEKAKILGECFIAVPEGSSRIPCVDSHAISEEIGEPDGYTPPVDSEPVPESVGTR